VLAFLQKERGLLRPGHKFQPLMTDEASARSVVKTQEPLPPETDSVSAK